MADGEAGTAGASNGAAATTSAGTGTNAASNNATQQTGAADTGAITTGEAGTGTQRHESTFDYSTSNYTDASTKTANEAFSKLIPDSFQKEEWVKNIIKSPEKNHATELLTQFANLQSKIGQRSEGLKVPGEDATPEEVKAFHKSLGVPDSLDDYKLEPPKIEEADKGFGDFLVSSRPDGFMSEIKTAAQGLGITPKQLQGLLDAHDAAFVKHNKEAIAEFAKNEQADVVDFEEQFTKMFGDKKQFVISENRKIMDSVIPADSPARVWLARQSNETLAGVAAVLEGFRQKFIREDSGFRGAPQTVSGGDPRKEAMALMGHPAYNKTDHPEYASIRRQVADLYKQADQMGQLGKK